MKAEELSCSPAIMITNCANPGCKSTLQSFVEGRFFHFDIVSVSISAEDGASGTFDAVPQSVAIQYWLCGTCSSSYSLILEPVRGLKLVPVGNTDPTPKQQGKESGIRDAKDC
jgi:hypothetical protein